MIGRFLFWLLKGHWEFQDLLDDFRYVEKVVYRNDSYLEKIEDELGFERVKEVLAGFDDEPFVRESLRKVSKK